MDALTDEEVAVLAEGEALDTAIKAAGGWVAYMRQQGTSDEQLEQLRTMVLEADGRIPDFMKE